MSIFQVNAMPVDTEYISLVNNVFRTQVPAYLWRAYTVVPAIENNTTHDIMVRFSHYFFVMLVLIMTIKLSVVCAPLC